MYKFTGNLTTWKMGRTGRKDRILSLSNFDYFEYSRFSALFDSSASCSALLEHTRIASITAESHIEPIKTKTKNYKGFPYWHNNLLISRLQGLFPGRQVSQNFKVGNQVYLMFDIGLSPGKKWKETRKFKHNHFFIEQRGQSI